jgi:hypothetical protein
MKKFKWIDAIICSLLITLWTIMPATAGGLDALEKGRVLRLLEELGLTVGGVAATSAISGTASQWSVDASGDLVPATNNADDVGDATYMPRTVRAATSVLSPAVDVASAGALSLGTTTATGITIGKTSGPVTTINTATSFDTNGRLLLPDGTSGTPSIRGSDADSGLYLSGTTTSLYVNNAAVLSVGTTGAAFGGNTATGYRRSVDNRTGDVSLNSTSSCESLQTNAGASGEVILSLPSAVAGVVVVFVVEAAQFLRVKAATGDVIRGTRSANVVAGTVESSATAGYWRSNVPGAHLEVTAIDATTWQVTGIGGTWTIDS